LPGSVAYDENLGIILVVNTGRVSADEFKKRTLETIEQAIEHRTNRILIDNSRLELAVSTNQVFQMPEFYENTNAYRGSLWAIIQPPEGPVLKELKFYETVCRNRGWLVKLFDDRQAAIGWLMTNSTEPPPEKAAV
jgi:hypothetical protein